jgi:diaminopimelate decarboxylase
MFCNSDNTHDMPTSSTPNPLAADPAFLEKIAAKIGTPFWLYDAGAVRRAIADVKFLTAEPGLQARYAMKASPATHILKEIFKAGIWIDAVSGNEALRAMRAGFPGGNEPPVILYTADVFRDNWWEVIRNHHILPNIGSPGQLNDLKKAGYRGAIALRINPGFGHGHVNACDTGGPSSKHGIWFQDALETAQVAEKLGYPVILIHAHVGSGPQQEELRANLKRLAEAFARIAPKFPHLQAVSLGGGLPHNYKGGAPIDLKALAIILKEAHEHLTQAVGHPVRLEIEPGRYFVAGSCQLVTRVTDVKKTRDNEKGQGSTFAMVDAGFVDLVRPAMYGSYHKISIPAREGQPTQPVVVAGPLCESGDVFTRDAGEFLAPRDLPLPQAGDLLVLHDAGAYGYSMSSNYNSIGRAPQIWLEQDGSTKLISRRETVDDLLKAEVEETI